MKKLRVAQIGFSETCHARPVLETALELPELYEVVGVSDVDIHRHPFHPSYDRVPHLTVEEILNDTTLDAVFIETDEVLQTQYAIAAAEKGLPIFMDKPGSVSDADFDRLIDLVEKKNLPFSIAYMYRTNPAVLKVLDAVKSGKLGKIYSVEAQMSCPEPEYIREFLKDLPGGMLYYLGCHLIDLIYQIQGEPLEVIPLSTKVEPEKPYGEDFGMAVFQYPCGVSFAKTCGAERGGFTRRQLVVHGTEGSLEICPLEICDGGHHEITCRLQSGFSTSWHEPRPSEQFPYVQRYRAMLVNFAAYVRGEKENPYSPDYERRLHKLILKACGVLK